MARRPFFDREEALSALAARHKSRRAELFVLYGRRRIGKSALLRHFCEEKAHAYFVATRVREADSLEALREVLHTAFGEPMLGVARFPDWEAALRTVLHLARGRRFVFILDEFQYLCQENPALPSILQKFWDTQAVDSRLMIVLCGSHIGFMEQEVLAERSPLFGRRTGQLRLPPLLPWDAMRFFPSWDLATKLRAYGILGGVPAYLERMDPARPFEDSVLREILSESGYLFDEVSLLLRTELGQAHTYMSLLKAIAGGSTRISEIGPKAGLPVTSAVRPLQVLCDLGFVRRDVPFDERHPERSKRGLYIIADPFVAFWCRYVLPLQSLLSSGQAAAVWRKRIVPDLPVYLGGVFEEACRLFVARRPVMTDIPDVQALRVGRLWGPAYEIDIAAELTDGTILLGECKAWGGPVGKNVLDDLKRRAASAPAGKGQRLLLCSMNGFTEPLRALAKVGEVLLLSGAQVLSP